MPKKPLKRKSSSPLTKPDSDRAVRKKAQAKKVPRKTAKRTKAKKPRPTAIQVVAAALDDLKALQVNVFDVRHLTSVTDTMVVASGRSDRHVRAVADAVSEQAKKAGYVPLGVEGKNSGEWVLVDLGDVVVHVMLPRTREFYNLEKLWDMTARDDSADHGA